jgi:nucleoside-diphosphate-sugar epimerase
MNSILPKRVILTGVTGFIGNHLARTLIRNGIQVFAIVRTGSDIKRIPDGSIVYEHDGSTSSLITIVSDIKPDIVIHLASCFIARHTPDNIDNLVDSNLKFGLQLLEAMSYVGCHNLINTGTGWQHFENRENDPVCLYAATKTAFESLIEYYVRVKSFSVITLKLHDTYGTDDTRGKLINLLLSAASTGSELDLSPGEQKIDLVYVDDVVNAYIKAMECFNEIPPGSHHRYMVTSGAPMSIKEMVLVIEEATGRKVHANWGARDYRDREVFVPSNFYPSVPHWEPIVNLPKGIELIYHQTENR